MKTVKIICGTYGHRKEGSQRVSPVQMGDSVELSDAEATRLVKRGVAAYVTATPTSVPPVEDNGGALPVSSVATANSGENSAGKGVNPTAPECGAESGERGILPAEERPAYNTDMPLTELKELMKLCGLSYTVGTSKLQIVSMLEDYFSNMDDGERAPEPEAEDVIV